MVFAAALLIPALLATAAFAAPSRDVRMANRLARRRAGTAHQSRPRQLVAEANSTEYSSNWSGVVFNEPKGTFTAVTGTFVVPTPQVPDNAGSGGDGSYSASAWVGIDGDTCGNAILQTGVDFTVDDSGEVSYDAWYEWYPDYAYDFSGIDISAGDTITVTVTASSTTKGKAVVENVSTGQTVSKSLTSKSALCEQDAEWIVEDYEEGSSLVPLANFGSVTFTDATATSKSGPYSPDSDSANIIDLRQNNVIYTSVEPTEDGVTISYVESD